jgi:hypothetical protein
MPKVLKKRLVMAATIAVLWVSVCAVAEDNLQGDIEVILTEKSLTGIAWSLVGGPAM